MSRFRLTDRAKADIDGIWDYIGIENHNPAAARSVLDALQDARLNSFPTIPAAARCKKTCVPIFGYSLHADPLTITSSSFIPSTTELRFPP